MTVFQIDARATAGDRTESDLNFARLRQVRLISPLGRDLPREDNAVRRFPRQHPPSVALGAVLLLGVATASDFPFYDRPLHRRLPNVVRPGPPGIELRGEYTERSLHTRAHGDRLADRTINRLFGRHCHCSSFASCSTFFLNAASARAQNTSKYFRSESIASGFTA